MKTNMFLTYQIAWRFLKAKKKGMVLSMSGIACGVSLFVITQAQAEGFQNFFVETILGINGAIRIEDKYLYRLTSLPVELEDGAATFQAPLREARKTVAGVPQPFLVMEAVKEFSDVSGAAQVLRGPIRASNGFTETDARVFGIQLEDYLSVTKLPSQVKYGSLQDFKQVTNGLILGSILAARLEVMPGDTVYLGALNERRRYRLSAIIETGVELYDKTSAFVDLREARQLLGRFEGASYLQVGLKDPQEAPRVARHMEKAIGHYVASWQHREKSWLEVFGLLKITSAATSTILLIIAGLGIFNTLAIIVMERQREIAILRAMGFSRYDISKVFLNLGLILLAIGVGAGWLLAISLTYLIEQLPIKVKGIFTTDHILVEYSFYHYIMATIVAGVMVFFASYLPARKAARTESGEIIRTTSG